MPTAFLTPAPTLAPRHNRALAAHPRRPALPRPCVAPVAPSHRRRVSAPRLCAGSTPTPPPPPPRDLAPEVKELRSVLKKCSLYFVGPMGSGKSAVAKFMATKIGFRFLDTDELIEAYAKKSIPTIFADDGEDNFRDIETAVLDQVAPFIGVCIATGGGAVLRRENWGRLQSGIVVYLDTPIDVLADRLRNETETGKRPLLNDAEDVRDRIEQIVAERRELYEQADVSIKVAEDMAVDDIANETIRSVTNFIKANPPRLASLYPSKIPKKDS